MPVKRLTQPEKTAVDRSPFPGRRTRVHEAFGEDHILNLERRLAGAEREPNNHDYTVSTEEICRVLALSNLPLEPATRRRLEAIGDGTAPRAPTGPKPLSPVRAMAQDFGAIFYHDRRRAQCEKLMALGGKTALRDTARRFGMVDVPTTPAQVAYEFTRRRYFSTISRSSVVNLITKIRKRTG